MDKKKTTKRKSRQLEPRSARRRPFHDMVVGNRSMRDTAQGISAGCRLIFDHYTLVGVTLGIYYRIVAPIWSRHRNICGIVHVANPFRINEELILVSARDYWNCCLPPTLRSFAQKMLIRLPRIETSSNKKASCIWGIDSEDDIYFGNIGSSGVLGNLCMAPSFVWLHQAGCGEYSINL
jgi:hypothetical protein